MKGMRGGTFAEYTTALPSEFARKPGSLSYAEAAAVPQAALTAWSGLFFGDSVKGKRILIHAAAGGVGHFATQLAKLKGAYVIGTGSARNEAFVKELGADEFVDYQKTPFETVARDIDIVLDTVGFDTSVRSCQVIKPGGTLVCFVTPPPAEEVEKHGIQARYASPQATPELLTEIAKVIDQGRVKPHVSQVLKLDDVHEALRLNQTQHTRGKVVMTVDA
jgi:NADPH:quinone reductase-like Zn-dependent oxidoreductase